MQDHWNGYLKAIGAQSTPQSTNTPQFESKLPSSPPKDMSVGWESFSIFKTLIPEGLPWFEKKPPQKK